MDQISIREIISDKRPLFLASFPDFLRELTFYIIEKLIHQAEMNDFIINHFDKRNFAFLDEVLEYLDFSFQVSAKDRNKIPSEGKLICVANHPLGGLDGLVLLKMLSEIRTDIKIVVNDILMYMDNLNDFFIPFDLTTQKIKRESIISVGKCLNAGKAVIFFPAGEVSRFSLKGIKDSKWNKAVISFAAKYSSPILPIYISGRNSLLFYFFSGLSKKFSSFLLPHELFNKRSKVITIKIGDYIPASSFSLNIYRKKYQANLLRKHVYLIWKNKKLYKTEKNVIHPIDKKILKRQIGNSQVLHEVESGKVIIAEFQNSQETIKEVARLREITFRKVGEGTGEKLDIDKYDKEYRHIIYWDENELEIVGSYRIAVCKDIIRKSGISGLYSASLFYISMELETLLAYSIELGRSFVQHKYWKSNALEYLWQGIGNFLIDNSKIRFMFGCVTLSGAYSDAAKNMIVFFYNKWFGKKGLARARNKYVIPDVVERELEHTFNSGEYKTELITLKNSLKFLGYSIPTLYKYYSELCEKGGVNFLDFCVDKNFNNCIDALILIDIEKIKKSKKNRYLGRKFTYHKSFSSA